MIGYIKNYCREDISMIKNYDKAIDDKEHIWECHHINELTYTRKELIKMNMYYNRPANEFIFLTISDHRRIHRTICEDGERRKAVSKALKGRPLPKWQRDFLKKCNTGRRHKPRGDFSKKFFDHYNITVTDNEKLWRREYKWYKYHNNKCRWEIKQCKK